MDDRRVLSGIALVKRNGLRWRNVPVAYGPHKALYNRWKRSSGRAYNKPVHDGGSGQRLTRGRKSCTDPVRRRSRRDRSLLAMRPDPGITEERQKVNSNSDIGALAWRSTFGEPVEAGSTAESCCS